MSSMSFFRSASVMGLVTVMGAALAACTSDDAPSPVPSAEAVDAGGARSDAGTEPPRDAAVPPTPPAQDCAAATSGLAQTADPSAPVLDAAKSNLQRVDSNDAFCAGKGFGKFPAFGPIGYQLSIAFADADGDGPSTLDEVQAAGVVRLASDPAISISTRTDPNRFSTGGGAIIIQLCLDKVYAASELAVGFDLADKAGHRAKAICVRQPSGG
jgi:hypothetical protein